MGVLRKKKTRLLSRITNRHASTNNCERSAPEIEEMPAHPNLPLLHGQGSSLSCCSSCTWLRRTFWCKTTTFLKAKQGYSAHTTSVCLSPDPPLHPTTLPGNTSTSARHLAEWPVKSFATVAGDRQKRWAYFTSARVKAAVLDLLRQNPR